MTNNSTVYTIIMYIGNETYEAQSLDPSNFVIFNRNDYFEDVIKYIVTAIYISVFVIGLIGNFITCAVILVGSSMKTTLNCYLFNLAIADTLLITLNVLTAVLNIWTPLYNVFQVNACFFGNYLAEVAVEVSMMTIIGLTIERFQIIRHPFKSQSTSRAIKIIIGLWIVAFIISYVPASQYYVVTNGFEAACFAKPDYVIPIFLTLASIFFIIPVFIIIALYVSIGVILIRLNKAKRDMTHNSSKGIDATTKKSLQITIAIVVAFFICFSPFYIIQLMTIAVVLFPNLNPRLIHFFQTPSMGKKAMNYTMTFFYLMSGAINPIIYNVVSKKFRDAFKETLVKISCAKKFRKTSSESNS